MRSLTPEQQTAITRLVEHDETILVAGTGVGKTVIALTAIQEMIATTDVERVIVAAPAKVLATGVWTKEVEKWPHLKGLKVVPLLGTGAHREATLEANQDAQVWVISLNSLNWLLFRQPHNAQGIIIDELSKAAGKQTKRMKSEKYAGKLWWRVGMTATPVSQNFEKLYAMCRIIDRGAALGTNKLNFMNRYFFPDYNGHDWTLKDGADAQLTAQVAPLVHVVPDNKASTLPPLQTREMRFEMSDSSREVYDEMRKHMVVGDVEAANQAVKSGKLRQIASGFMYDDDGEPVRIDSDRLNAAANWWNYLAGEPGFIFYEFTEQLEQLQAVVPANVKLAQITSMSHGVDGLQHNFNKVLFYQPHWSRDVTEQAIGRFWRQGQTKPVEVTTLICEDTLDDVVVARVEGNARWMETFVKHLTGDKNENVG